MAADKQMIAFWRPTDPDGYLGQWWKSNFCATKETIEQLQQKFNLQLFKDKPNVSAMLCTHDNYTTTEQFMMMGKAALFGDKESFAKMSLCNNPKMLKSLGRKVKFFDEVVWNKYSMDIVIIGNYHKFSQSSKLCKQLLGTGKAMLVEASPMDRVWGIGLKFDDPRVNDLSKWRGENKLGKCLEIVRSILQKK